MWIRLVDAKEFFNFVRYGFTFEIIQIKIYFKNISEKAVKCWQLLQLDGEGMQLNVLFVLFWVCLKMSLDDFMSGMEDRDFL